MFNRFKNGEIVFVNGVGKCEGKRISSVGVINK